MQDQLLKFETEVKGLTDTELLKRIERIFVLEKKCGDAILLGLKEIKTRRLFITAGYSSLFEMLIKFYKLSETMAYQKISTLKLIESVPLAQEALLNNQVSSSTLAEVQSFINKTEKTSETKMPAYEKEKLVNEILDKTLKQTKEILGDKNPELALPPDREKTLTSEITLLQIKVERETMTLLNELKSLLSHQIPDGNLKDLLKTMAEISIEEIKKRKGINENKRGTLEEISELKLEKNAIEKIEQQIESCTINLEKSPILAKPCIKRSRHIPSEVKRDIFSRAKGHCEYIHLENGERCQSRHQLEFDHAQSFSQGGSHDPSNISLKCRAHNLYRTKETHGYWYQV
jgi:hypothetical protein